MDAGPGRQQGDCRKRENCVRDGDSFWVHIPRHKVSEASVPDKQDVSCKTTMNQYRDETMEMCKHKGWDKATVSTVWMLYTEESGELASAIRQMLRTYRKTGLKKDKGTDVTQEMGDVFSYLFQLAGMLNIDLDQMWTLHREKVQGKVYPCTKNVGIY